MKILAILILITSTVFSQTSGEQSFKLQNGTVIIGNVLEENDQIILVQTKYGQVTINKTELLRAQFEITLITGEKLIGFKTSETPKTIILRTQMGELTIQKSDISNIQELGNVAEGGSEKTQPVIQYQRPYSLTDFLFSGRKIDKNTEFAIGEEQLIDLFFDPTGYTLEQSTMYLSGLSFGFGVTDKLQITTKWGSFFWGDMNIRPKLQIFEKGNWEKQSSLSIGLHYHTRWFPNKYEWKSGDLSINGTQKYWGGFYTAGQNPEYIEICDSTEVTDCWFERSDDSEDELIKMLEIFGAYTFSKARKGLKGRISHTLGGHVQYAMTVDDPTVLYRAYYGLDVDINPQIKMVGEIFYDPFFLESWQQSEYGEYGEDIEGMSNSPVEKPDDYSPVHLDFGFIYVFNETFRFGLHFQKPFVAFYWKF